MISTWSTVHVWWKCKSFINEKIKLMVGKIESSQRTHYTLYIYVY